MTKTILCLGADGYLGWNFALYYAHKYNTNKVVCVDNYIKRFLLEKSNCAIFNNDARMLDKINFCNTSKKKYNMVSEYGDVADKEFVSSLLIKYKPDIIINCAGINSNQFMAGNHESMQWSMKNNQDIVLNILWSVNELKLKPIIVQFTSLKQNPDSVNELQHIFLSTICKSLSKKWRISVLECGIEHVYGLQTAWNQQPQLYPRITYDQVFGELIHTLIANMFRSTKIIVYGDEQQFIYPVHINDLTDMVDDTIKKQKMQYQKVNIYAEKLKVGNIIMLLQSEIKRLNLDVVITKVKGDVVISGDISTAKHIVPVKPMKNLQTYFTELVTQFQGVA